MRLGHGELRLRHVDADDPAGFTGQLRQRIHIATRTAAQVEHLQSLELS
jgi:hypothetical protein